MGLSVTFVSGLRRSGKSAVIRSMIDRVWKVEPHYIRLVRAGGEKHRPKSGFRIPRNCGVASARWLEYEPDCVFDVLPSVLTDIHREDRFGAVILEADSDPSLRCAYPYDHRIFVMPVPSGLRPVFRDPSRAAVELQRVLDDTSAFASEMFGLRSSDGQDEPDPSEYRPRMDASQMRGFLGSPLGDELATRIQLQPPYHALVESDIVIVNTGAGRHGAETDECLQRIKRLLERTNTHPGQSGRLFFCDPLITNSKYSKQLFKALEPMGVGGA